LRLDMQISIVMIMIVWFVTASLPNFPVSALLPGHKLHAALAKMIFSAHATNVNNNADVAKS